MVGHLWQRRLLAVLLLVLLSQSPLLAIAPFLLLPVSVRSSLSNGYGYGPGDSYRFSDLIAETLDTQQTHVLFEKKQTIEVSISAIDEGVANYTIRITARVANLTAGLGNYSVVEYMEGDSPIVAGPRVYFTLTNWHLHLTDWEQAVSAWQQETQMSGSVFYDLDQRLFSWNLSRFVDTALSLYDVNSDGVFDSYDHVHSYVAQFDERGVVELRSWYSRLVFQCGALYTRLHAITLLLRADAPPLLSAEAILLVFLIASASAALMAALVFITRQQSRPSSSGREGKASEGHQLGFPRKPKSSRRFRRNA